MRKRRVFKVWRSRDGETRIYLVDCRLSSDYLYFRKCYPSELTCIGPSDRDYRCHHTKGINSIVEDITSYLTSVGFYWSDYQYFDDLLAYAESHS